MTIWDSRNESDKKQKREIHHPCIAISEGYVEIGHSEEDFFLSIFWKVHFSMTPEQIYWEFSLFGPPAASTRNSPPLSLQSFEDALFSEYIRPWKSSILLSWRSAFQVFSVLCIWHFYVISVHILWFLKLPKLQGNLNWQKKYYSISYRWFSKWIQCCS